MFDFEGNGNDVENGALVFDFGVDQGTEEVWMIYHDSNDFVEKFNMSMDFFYDTDQAMLMVMNMYLAYEQEEILSMSAGMVVQTTDIIVFTEVPSEMPTFSPTFVPSPTPSAAFEPSATPSLVPTLEPSELPSVAPTSATSTAPSVTPSTAPISTMVTMTASAVAYNVTAADFDEAALTAFVESVADNTEGVEAEHVVITDINRRRLRSSSSSSSSIFHAAGASLSSVNISFQIVLVMEELGFTSVQDLVDDVEDKLAAVDFSDPEFTAAFIELCIELGSTTITNETAIAFSQVVVEEYSYEVVVNDDEEAASCRFGKEPLLWLLLTAVAAVLMVC
jgi:hypothetical protein